MIALTEADNTTRQIPAPKPPMSVQRETVARLGHQAEAAEGLTARCREKVEALPAALLRQVFG